MFGQFRRVVVMVGAGVVAAAVLAGSSVLAAPVAGEEGTSGAGKYADRFVTKLATLLNVEKDVLVTSMKQAGNDTVDEAVAAGDLTQQQGEQIKERIADGNFPTFESHGRQGQGEHRGMKGVIDPHEVAGAVAVRLGMTSDQLLQELKSGKTLHEIGQEKGVSDADLKAAMLGVVQPKLTQAVADGKLTQQQADRIVVRIQNSDLDRKMFGTGAERKEGSGEDGHGYNGGNGNNGNGSGEGQN